MAEPVFDALVIGSGATGCFAAQELTAQGLRVLMLEAGRKLDAADFDPARKPKIMRDPNILERAEATLRGQHVQARAAFFRKWSSHLFINDRRDPYTTPRNAPFIWVRGRQEGGRLHSFGRVLMRWSDDDFKSGSRRGKGSDWPISYDDLSPFYGEVEQCLGLVGNRDGLADMPDGIYAHDAVLSPAEAEFRSRVEARRPGQRVVAWRYMLPDPSRVYAPLRAALETGLLTLRHRAIARRITTDPQSGLATGAEILDEATGKTEILRAASVVLCASPVESIRLLCNSAGGLHPRGIGNGGDMLGRYFMDQLPCVSQGVFAPVQAADPAPIVPPDPFYGASGGIWLAREPDPSGGHNIGEFAFQGMIGRGLAGPGGAARLAFFGFGEMDPDAENRVTTDPRRKDAAGSPVAHIRCAIGPKDRETLRRGEAHLLDTVTGAGGEFGFIGTPLGLHEMGRGAYPAADFLSRMLFRRFFHRTLVMGAAIHESGGARMGDSPQTSVLNRYNQCWEAPNICVADASAFVTGGVTGTTLTAMALTLRACRHLATQIRDGRILGV